MASDLSTIFVWWSFILGLGLIFLPLTKRIFNNFFDRGYLFAKVLGILFSSYIVWLLASLKILPFYQETIWLVLILGLIVNLLLSSKKNPLPTSHFPSSLLIFAGEEFLFLSTLVFWSFVRGLQPDIQGLEKFMDFGFINSILRSRYFPPADMWFAGKSINYYYYGHYVTAFLTKLTGISSAITYNLMMATLFAFCFSLTFSLTGNLIFLFFTDKFKNLKLKIENCFEINPPAGGLKFIIVSGLISAFLISLGANLHSAYYNFKMGILKKPYCDGATTYWYPNATRYIGYCPNVEDKTIHEFPSYSFIVSDLHGHVSDIPFVLLFLALALNLFLSIKEEKNKTFNFKLLTFNLLMSLTLATMYMTNQWDFPIYLLVLGLILLLGFFQHYQYSAKTLIKSVISGVFILLPAIFLVLPFQLNFEQIAKGIAFVRAHSLPHQLLILWGAPWFFGLTFLFFLFGHKIKSRIKTGLKKEAIIKWLANTLGVEAEIKKIDKSSSLITNYQLLITDIFILILFLVSTILIIVPEIIYVKDIYIPSYHRANTMFKLTYQSFVMFSIGIGYIFVRVLSSLKRGFIRKILFTFYFILFTSLMVYPYYSIRGYYGDLSLKNYKGLFGLKFLERLYPDDYKLVLFLNEKIPDQPVVLEAVGDSYTDFERLSMATGLPTIEGWLVHEWLWRGSFDEPGKRSGEVQTIYESKDLNQTKELLQKYQVKYIVVGEMEHQKYPNLEEKKLNLLGKKIFESNNSYLLELF